MVSALYQNVFMSPISAKLGRCLQLLVHILCLVYNFVVYGWIRVCNSKMCCTLHNNSLTHRHDRQILKKSQHNIHVCVPFLDEMLHIGIRSAGTTLVIIPPEENCKEVLEIIFLFRIPVLETVTACLILKSCELVYL